MKTILHLFLHTLAIMIASYIIPGVTVPNWFTALVLAVVLGILNTFLKPILIFLTLPVTILTLGLFALVINTALILLATLIVPGFAVAGFFTAFIFGIVLFFINAFFSILL
ncbi:MAG: phage holin family protein [Candidatus Paceibacterota bacterium]|jgi:putative membrane protein|nr:phage holin family protein [Candidatus Paceibacterota bacterium]